MIFYPHICLDFFSVLDYNEIKEKENHTSYNHTTGSLTASVLGTGVRQ